MHEVQDVMAHIVGNMHYFLTKGESVHLSGIGHFTRRRVKPRVFAASLDNVPRLVYTSDSVSFRPDTTLRRVMKEAREQGYDREAYILWLQELEDQGDVPSGTVRRALALPAGEYFTNLSKSEFDELEPQFKGNQELREEE